MMAEAVAFLIELDRLVERCLAALEQTNDLLEPREGRFEAQFAFCCSGTSMAEE